MTMNGGDRRTGRLAMVACVGFLLLTGVGCASPPAPAETSVTPTAAPVFASDEEALAAATEAYANYQAMADVIDSEGGRAPERITPFVSEGFLPEAIHQSDGFRESNARSIGSTTFVVDAPQRLSYSDSKKTVVSLYICDDVTAVDVVDQTGNSLVSDTRVAVTPFAVSFVLGPGGDLVVDSREVWKGDNFC